MKHSNLLLTLLWIISCPLLEGFAGLSSPPTLQRSRRDGSIFVKNSAAFTTTRDHLLRLSSSTDAAASSSQESSATTTNPTTATPTTPVVAYHHTAFRVRNITTAIAFYSLLGFEVEHKFLIESRYKAAWIKAGNLRIEFLEAKDWVLDEPPGMKRRALDLITLEELLGLNHFAMDVTHLVDSDKNETLQTYISKLNNTSVERFGRTIRLAVEPAIRVMGNYKYEYAFLYDCDGALLELIRKSKERVEEGFENSSWEVQPWDQFLKLMTSGKRRERPKPRQRGEDRSKKNNKPTTANGGGGGAPTTPNDETPSSTTTPENTSTD